MDSYIRALYTLPCYSGYGQRQLSGNMIGLQSTYQMKWSDYESSHYVIFSGRLIPVLQILNYSIYIYKTSTGVVFIY
jgi:hypothetical protein